MMFQGKPVHASKVVLSGGAKEVFSGVPKLDQIVQVTLEGRVTGVDYRVNDSSGELEEVVRIKVVDVSDVETLTYPREVSTPGPARSTVPVGADGNPVEVDEDGVVSRTA